MVQCARCGARVDGAYCGNCGARAIRPEEAGRHTAGGRNVRNALVAVIVVSALVIVGGLGYIFTRSGDANASATGSSSPGASQQAGTTPGAPRPTPTNDADATAKLNSWATADARRSQPNGSWLVQLDSKYVGIVDPTQQAAPFTAMQIWHRFERYRTRFPNQQNVLRVLRSTDFGKQTAGAKVYWALVLKLDLNSRDDALAWCMNHFPQRGKALENRCYPRRFTAPQG